MSVTRSQIFSIFKKLHRTRKTVFDGDVYALNAAREKINSEFRKNAAETDSQKLEKLFKTATDAELVLRTTVVQAKLNEERRAFEVKLRKDLPLEDALPFDEHAVIPTRQRNRKTKCQDDKS